ncbi:MAG: DUF4160 domain-containing protein [Flavobacteriaceae bacterium]|nr:DUF4160 domain-containing protein [Flavobacteriaceae bacterium]
MPTLFTIFGFKFFFYSNEHLPIHIHITKSEKEAKFELQNDEFVLKTSKNMKVKDLAKLEKLVEIYKEEIVEAWEDYFKNKL